MSSLTSQLQTHVSMCPWHISSGGLIYVSDTACSTPSLWPSFLHTPPRPQNLCLSHTPLVSIRSRSCQLPPPAVHDKDPAITINASFPRFVPCNVSSDSVSSTFRICAAHFCPPPPLPPWTNPPTSLFCSSTHPVQVRRTCASYPPVIHLKSHPGAAPPKYEQLP